MDNMVVDLYISSSLKNNTEINKLRESSSFTFIDSNEDKDIEPNNYSFLILNKESEGIYAYSAQIGHQFQSIPATCSRLNRPPNRSEATPVFYYFSDLFFLVKEDRIFLMDSPFKFIL